MRSLSEVEVARAVALLEDGRSMRFVANSLNTSPSVICRLWHRYQITGSYSRRAGQGCKRKTTNQNDRYIVTSPLWRRTATARELQNHYIFDF
jgi:transposase